MTDRCNYAQIEKDFPWVFEPNSPLIVSFDIDGITSALLWNHVLGCRVEGIYTLDALWTAPGVVGEDPEEDMPR